MKVELIQIEFDCKSLVWNIHIFVFGNQNKIEVKFEAIKNILIEAIQQNKCLETAKDEKLYFVFS